MTGEAGFHPPVEEYLAAGRAGVPGDHVEQGRLARPVGADDPEDLAAGHGEAHIVDRPQAAEALADLAGLEDGAGRHFYSQLGSWKLPVAYGSGEISTCFPFWIWKVRCAMPRLGSLV